MSQSEKNSGCFCYAFKSTCNREGGYERKGIFATKQVKHVHQRTQKNTHAPTELLYVTIIVHANGTCFKKET